MADARTTATISAIHARVLHHTITNFIAFPQYGPRVIQGTVHGVVLLAHDKELAMLRVGVTVSTNVEILLQQILTAVTVQVGIGQFLIADLAKIIRITIRV